VVVKWVAAQRLVETKRRKGQKAGFRRFATPSFLDLRERGVGSGTVAQTEESLGSCSGRAITSNAYLMRASNYSASRP
jgi:hypothetical protein